MTNSLPADFHMHTHNSGDSDAPMKAMIESFFIDMMIMVILPEVQRFQAVKINNNIQLSNGPDLYARRAKVKLQ